MRPCRWTRRRFVRWPSSAKTRSCARHTAETVRRQGLFRDYPLQGIIGRIGNSATVTYARGYGSNVSPALAQEAVQAAKNADVAIVFAGLGHGPHRDTEGTDRVDLRLPDGQDDLIDKVQAANPKTIVVLVAGSPVQMDPWLAHVPAVLDAWYSGMEGGNAIARVLFGDVNPSGKLPCTFPKQLEDSPAHAFKAYPGTNGTVRYYEGILVGYRYFDTIGVEPLFPFGDGLSYTHFGYSQLDLAPGSQAEGPVVTVKFQLANVGKRAGAEVAQVYVHPDKSSISRPFQALKAFRKVFLHAGRKQNNFDSPRPERVRFLRSETKRMAGRKGRLYDLCQQQLARPSPRRAVHS